MKYLYSLLFITLLGTVFSQSPPIADTVSQVTPDKNLRIQGFPVAFFSPETRLAVGAVGIGTFRWKSDTLNARPSSITLGAAYTQNKQILFYLPFNLFVKNDAYRYNGEVGYFKYNFFYFGVGNSNDINAKESYEVTFPRLRINAYKKVGRGLFVGLRYGFDQFKDLKFQPGGMLEKSTLSGVNGGVNSSIGAGILIDRKDHQFYPRSGYTSEFHFGIESKWTGSDFCFKKFNFDLTGYYSLFKKSVIAGNFNMQSANGNIPFYMMSLLGGGKRLRGQFEGLQRDLHSLQTQIEWRQEFLKNWGCTVFGGAGVVTNTYNDLIMKRINYGYGAGLRYKLNKKEHVNIRLDVGFGGGQLLPYFTIAEAF